MSKKNLKKTPRKWILAVLIWLITFPPTLLAFLVYIVLLLVQKFILRRPTEKFSRRTADWISKQLKKIALIFWLLVAVAFLLWAWPGWLKN